MVSDIPAGGGKIADLFLQCISQPIPIRGIPLRRYFVFGHSCRPFSAPLLVSCNPGYSISDELKYYLKSFHLELGFTRLVLSFLYRHAFKSTTKQHEGTRKSRVGQRGFNQTLALSYLIKTLLPPSNFVLYTRWNLWFFLFSYSFLCLHYFSQSNLIISGYVPV